MPFIRGRVWRKRSGQPARGVVVTVHADGGAELARLETDDRGVFEWHDTYAVLTYFLWPHARGVDYEITTWWPAAAFHEKELYLPCRARDASWGEKVGHQPW